MEHDSHVTLRPDRGVAARWTLVGMATIGVAIWIAVDAEDSVLAWAFVALCLVVTAYVVIQLVRPARFLVHLDPSGLEAALPWQHLRVPWHRVHLARVVRVTGEPVLELHVWDAEDPAQDTPRATGILLPLGADLDRLHQQLALHLGRAEDPVPRPTHPPT